MSQIGQSQKIQRGRRQRRRASNLRRFGSRDAGFFSASMIASAARLSDKRVIRRQAARESWLTRRNGNRFEYAPPRRLLARCLSLAAEIKEPTARSFHVNEAMRAEALRVGHRVNALVEFDRLVSTGLPIETALRRAAQANSFSTSPSSLRRWLRAFAVHGIAGLAERKRGRVGRKPSNKAKR